MNSGGEMKRIDKSNDVHIPVLLEECLDALCLTSSGYYADLTLGGGGHATAVLEQSKPGGFLLGLDRDPGVLAETQEKLKSYEDRIKLVHGNFDKAAELFQEYLGKLDGIIMDLGLSSFQLDRSSRGFSIFKDGPLDLRMDTSQALTGKDFVNSASREELIHALGVFGEEPKAKAVAKAIINERQKRPLLHTSDIRRIVELVYGRKGGKIHPATRTFQGLRMAVNEELDSLRTGLESAFQLLKTGGRMCVIAFHSGEDRIVKEFAKNKTEQDLISRVTRKPIQPGQPEIRRNRRSRSARMRVLEKKSGS